MRCKHGPEEGEGGQDGGAAPRAKRAKLAPGEQPCPWEGPFYEIEVNPEP